MVRETVGILGMSSATLRFENSRVGFSDLSLCILWPHPCQIPVGILGQECNLA